MGVKLALILTPPGEDDKRESVCGVKFKTKRARRTPIAEEAEKGIETRVSMPFSASVLAGKDGVFGEPETLKL